MKFYDDICEFANVSETKEQISTCKGIISRYCRNGGPMFLSNIPADILKSIESKFQKTDVSRPIIFSLRTYLKNRKYLLKIIYM